MPCKCEDTETSTSIAEKRQVKRRMGIFDVIRIEVRRASRRAFRWILGVQAPDSAGDDV